MANKTNKDSARSTHHSGDMSILSEDDQNVDSRRKFKRLDKPQQYDSTDRNGRTVTQTSLLPSASTTEMSQRFIVKPKAFFDIMQEIAPFTNLDRDRKRYYFRGEPCSSFQLLPSLLRDNVYGRLSEQHHASSPIDLQRKLLDRYRRYTQHLIHSDNDFSAPIWEDFDTLCLAQHYGLPTLLMDWTLNPYVSAYFALSGAYKTYLREKVSAYPNITTYCVRVWVMRLKSPDRRQPYTIHLEDRKSRWDEKLGDVMMTPSAPLIVVPLVFTRRIAAQAGRFLYCGYMSKEVGSNGVHKTNGVYGVRSLAQYAYEQCKTNEDKCGYLEDRQKTPEELSWDQLFSLDIEFDISSDDHRKRWEVEDLEKRKDLKLDCFRQEVLKMMSELEFIGFHAGRLFPDLEGWARYLTEGNL